MGFLVSLLGRRRPARASAAPAAAQPSRDSRRESLSMAVRETLRKHGIPQAWLGAETVPASTPAEPKGLHLRLVIRQSHPKFLANLYALERAIHAQLLQQDAQYTRWLMGTSWRMEVRLGSDATQLPGAEFWQTKAMVAPMAAAAQATPAAQPQPASTRDSVARALQARDSAFSRTMLEAPEFSPTQPMVAR